MTHIEQFIARTQEIITCFDRFVVKHKLVGQATADHICFKCSGSRSFEQIRGILESSSKYTFQSFISGRRILIVRLSEGLETELGTIHFVELCDKKPTGQQVEGFDHIEVYPTEGSIEEMMGGIGKEEQVVEKKRPHHTTHDVAMSYRYTFRCTQEPLIAKIKRDEMVC